MTHIMRMTWENLWRSGCCIRKDIFAFCSAYNCNTNSMNKYTRVPSLCNRRHIFTDKLPSSDRPYTPRRTLIYVPGHDTKKLKKIPSLGSDCVILECEDGVAINMKAQARINIREALDYLNADSFDLALRVNSRSSDLMEADLAAIIGDDLGPPANVTRLPKTILLPKVDTVDDVIFFTEKLQSVKLGREYRPYLLIYVESAQGLINLNGVLKRASGFTKQEIFQLDGVIFGSDDFIANIGAERTSDAKEVMYARQHIVMVAKAYGLQAIDLVFVDIHDQEGLRVQSEEGARFGYTGKQVIHPAQLPIVETSFTPSKARIEWATELIKNFNEHQSKGKGAFTFRGQMIDMPLLLQAKNTLRIVQNVKKTDIAS